MVPEGENIKTARRDWQDANTYRSLYQFDRAALDLAFARCHAERQTETTIPVDAVQLRATPRIRLLTHIADEEPPDSWGLRFCRPGHERKPRGSVARRSRSAGAPRDSQTGKDG